MHIKIYCPSIQTQWDQTILFLYLAFFQMILWDHSRSAYINLPNSFIWHLVFPYIINNMHWSVKDSDYFLIFFFFGGLVLSNYATKSIIIHTSFSIYVNTSACTIAKSKGSWIKIKFIAITKLLSKQLYQLTSLLTKHSNVYFLAHSQTVGIKLFNPC